MTILPIQVSWVGRIRDQGSGIRDQGSGSDGLTGEKVANGIAVRRVPGSFAALRMTAKTDNDKDTQWQRNAANQAANKEAA
jgi:hypothetical protein